MNIQLPSPLQKLESPLLTEKRVDLWMKRDDLIHSEISGNKWRKLKFNILKAQEKKTNSILTFGGAYSNHILATAAACSLNGLRSIGIIRGEETLPLNPTLAKAKKLGMEIHYVSRADYKNKDQDWFIQELREKYGTFHLVPEGGANYYGVMGCMEILPENQNNFDIVCCANGTGTTLAGILLSAKTDQKVLGFPALKGGDFIRDNVNHLLKYSLFEDEMITDKMNQLSLETSFHFGGYGKVKPELVDFVNGFYSEFNIPLDLVYTGKMMFGLFELIREDHFSVGTKIMAVHTGGLQGNKGMKERLGIELVF
ncbi:MAG: 1-aminocyclopropane-1-carboxylate deaminase/D-cysteine desulfhydrase [Salibacteraceae bacterium]